MARKYERINFVIAHLGGFFMYDDRLPAALQRVAKIDNIFFDTAMVTDAQVINCAISVLGYHKILFGSDAPFGYFRGKFIRENGRTIFLPDDDWSWRQNCNQKENSHSNMVLLDSILAIKEGLQSSLGDCLVDFNLGKYSIFYANAKSLLNGIRPDSVK